MLAVSSWLELGVPNDVAAKLRALGLAKPTLTQRVSIPKILNTDLNVLLCAPTGSGKTEAALIPSLMRCSARPKPISLLYVTPLRALNRDIERRISRVASIFNMTAGVWHGDTPSSKRRKLASSPPNILVTTPESLQVVLVNKSLRKHLRNCQYVIIDEAHEVEESERGVELVVGLRRLDVLAKRRIRRIALTAPHGGLESLAEFLFYPYKYVVIDVGASKRYEILVDSLGSGSRDTRSFLEILYCVPKLVDIIRKYREKRSQVLIFVNTRIAAEELGYILRSHFHDVGVHHGSLSREIRESVESGLRNREINVAIATSSLELGIDIGGIDIVVQVMSPRQVSRLIQRVGRAGHREDAVSSGIVLAPPMLIELLESAVIARRAINGELETPKPHTNSLDALLHQLVGIVIEWGSIDRENAFRLVKSTHPYRDLRREDLEQVIELAEKIGFVASVEGKLVPRKRGEIYYRTTTMIVDTSKYRVRDLVEMRSIATLDEEFIATCREGDVLVLSGRLWRLVSIDDESKTVYVEPVARVEEARLPRWVGENIPVSFDVAQEVCSLLENLCSCSTEVCIDSILSRYPLTEDAKRAVKEFIPDICRIHLLTTRISIEVSTARELPYVLIYSCLGSRGSEALALVVSELIRSLLGVRCSYRSHQIGTLVVPSRPLSRSEIRLLLSKLKSLTIEEASSLLIKGLEDSPLFEWYILKVAKKMGLVSRNVSIVEAKRVIEGLKNIDVVKREALRELMTEKIDIDALERFLRKLHSGTKIVVYMVDKPSTIAREIISLAPSTISLGPPVSKQALSSVVLSRLVNRTVRLLCLSCLYTWSINIRLYSEGCSTLEELKNRKISCPQCGSLAITVVDDEEELRRARGIVKRIHRGSSRLCDEELKILDRMRKIANLVMDYGLAALIALQGVGIGPETAKRILSRAKTIEDLVALVLERQRAFLRTRRFWRS